MEKRDNMINKMMTAAVAAGVGLASAQEFASASTLTTGSFAGSVVDQNNAAPGATATQLTLASSASGYNGYNYDSSGNIIGTYPVLSSSSSTYTGTVSALTRSVMGVSGSGSGNYTYSVNYAIGTHSGTSTTPIAFSVGNGNAVNLGTSASGYGQGSSSSASIVAAIADAPVPVMIGSFTGGWTPISGTVDPTVPISFTYGVSSLSVSRPNVTIGTVGSFASPYADQVKVSQGLLLNGSSVGSYSGSLGWANNESAATKTMSLATNSNSLVFNFLLLHGQTVSLSLQSSLTATAFEATGPGTASAVSPFGTNILTQTFNVGAGQLTWGGAPAAGGSLWDNNVSQNWTISGNATNFLAGDKVTFNDTNSGHYAVKLNTVVQPGSVLFNNNTAYTVSGTGGIAGAGAITKLGTGALTISTINPSTGPVVVSAGSLVLAPSGSLATSDLTVNLASAQIYGTLNANPNVTVSQGKITFAGTPNYPGPTPLTLSKVTLSNGGKFAVVDPGVGNHANRTAVVVDQLNISGATGVNGYDGQLDLNGNDLIVHNGNVFNLTSQVQSGYNGGTFTGTGITSSAAASAGNVTLGVISNDDGTGNAIYGSFDNQPAVASDVFVKYVYFGDANVDGLVDGSDYTRIDAGFNQPVSNIPPGWKNGDFNYDNLVDGSDYTLIDNSFNTQGSNLSAPTAVIASDAVQFGQSAAVPEPGALSLIVVAGLRLLRRRRVKLGV